MRSRCCARSATDGAPFFEDFRLEPRALNENTIRLEWRRRTSEAHFDAASLSDGTLRFIALATLLLQPPALRPSVILLDEPELGLHPYVIAILASLVKQASVDTQIVLSTQSSLLLDEFRPEDQGGSDRGLQEIRDAFDSPEEIDDSPNSAPSKRVEALVAGYQKPWMEPSRPGGWARRRARRMPSLRALAESPGTIAPWRRARGKVMVKASGRSERRAAPDARERQPRQR